jgi:hypothetical protein
LLLNAIMELHNQIILERVCHEWNGGGLLAGIICEDKCIHPEQY